jgi:hypothetical protein
MIKMGKRNDRLERDEIAEVGTNVVVLSGTVSREIREREIATSELVVEFSFRCDDVSRALVPLVWPSPPKWAMKLKPGDGLVVLGAIRQRFFHAGGVRQTRTEVVVERCARRTSTAGCAAIVDSAIELIAS